MGVGVCEWCSVVWFRWNSSPKNINKWMLHFNPFTAAGICHTLVVVGCFTHTPAAAVCAVCVNLTIQLSAVRWNWSSGCAYQLYITPRGLEAVNVQWQQFAQQSQPASVQLPRRLVFKCPTATLLLLWGGSLSENPLTGPPKPADHG